MRICLGGFDKPVSESVSFLRLFPIPLAQKDPGLSFHLENYEIYKQLHHPENVGTFLAIHHLGKVKSMTDSHFPASKRTIMVVDDCTDLVTIVRLLLENAGFNVMCAYNGTQLFDGLEKQKPDLILLDIMMPKMDGMEVLTRLKGDPSTASIPVILLTAKMLYEDVLEGYKLGADEYITKPFTRTQLMTSINRLLRGPDYSPSLPIASA